MRQDRTERWKMVLDFDCHCKLSKSHYIVGVARREGSLVHTIPFLQN